MKPSSTVSAVIIHYNDSQALLRAVISAKEQTLAPLEIIVVDDHSTPYHAEEARRISRDAGATLIESPKNSGPATARNLGWAASKGDFVAFLDSDDIWHRDKLRCQMRVARVSSDVVLVSGGNCIVTESKEFYGTELNEAFHYLSSLEFLVHNPVHTSSALVRANVRSRFPEGKRLAEDYHLWLSLSREGRAAKIDGGVVASFKLPFGESGLSKQIWGMLRSESKIYPALRREGVLTTGEMCVALIIFLPRAIRRISIHWINGLNRIAKRK